MNFDRGRPAGNIEPFELTGGLPPPDDWSDWTPPEQEAAPRRPRRWLRWTLRGLGAGIILLVIAIGWLAVTAPLSQIAGAADAALASRCPPPTARRSPGAARSSARRSTRPSCPTHVTEAFLAIEDRRFYIALGHRSARHRPRRLVTTSARGGVAPGRQHDHPAARQDRLPRLRPHRSARKVREMLIAFWLEAWLTKDEILSRYLSNVYFGDNVYGLRAAAQHYFSRKPREADDRPGGDARRAGQGAVAARARPSNLQGRARRGRSWWSRRWSTPASSTEARRDAVAAQRVLDVRETKRRCPTGTYFADWVLPAARDQRGRAMRDADGRRPRSIAGCSAPPSARSRAPGSARRRSRWSRCGPTGASSRWSAGTNYADSPFNRATQARRQPGSTFKLFVYLAALRAGMTPGRRSSTTRRSTIAGWKPKNDDGRYLGEITLRQRLRPLEQRRRGAADPARSACARSSGGARSRHLHAARRTRRRSRSAPSACRCSS